MTPGAGPAPFGHLDGTGAATATTATRQVPFQIVEPVHDQVFAAMTPVIRGEDGSYDIQLQLRPKDLGTVQVSVTVHHGEVSVQMNAADPAARDALRQGMSDLRQQLDGQGLRAGSMEVGSGGADPRQPDRPWRSAGSRPSSDPGPTGAEHIVIPIALARTGLDLRM